MSLFNYSEYLKRYLDEADKNLTDSQKAAVIWNSKKISLRNKKMILSEFAKITEDAKLIKEIQERIDFEDNKFANFIKSDSRSIYVITDVTDEKHIEYGIFARYEAARHELDFMLGDDINFNIEKRTLYDEDHGEYEEDSVMVLNTEGTLMAIHTKDNSEFNEPERFENQIINK